MTQFYTGMGFQADDPGERLTAAYKQSRLGKLLSDGYAAPQEGRGGLLAQMARISPDAAFSAEDHFGKMDDRARTQFGREAALFAALPPEMQAQAYPEFVQKAKAQGIPAPDQWNPEFAPHIGKIAQAFGAQGGASGVQSTYVDGDGNRVAIMRDGSVQTLGANDMGMSQQTITVEGPNGEPVQMTFDKRTGNYRPISMGGSSAMGGLQPNSVYQTPNGVVRIGDVAPGDMEAVAADMQQPFAAGEVSQQLPPRVVEPQQRQWTQNTPNPYGNAMPGVGMTAADKAFAQEEAKQRAQIGAMPTVGRIEAENAGLKARTEADARAAVERESIAATKAVDAQRTLGLLDEAERLLPMSTGSSAGSVVDAIGGAFGYSTAGAQAIAALQTIAGQLTSSMPRMQGPQSDKDVQLYKQMAGDLANPNLPIPSRMAALRQIRRLNEKYAGRKPDAPRSNAVPVNNAGSDPLGIL